jgi:hypothetical protein
VTSLTGEMAALIAAEAESTLPGAGVDPQTGDLVVPMASGEARISLDSLAAQLQIAEPEAAAELVRHWFAELAASLNTAASPSPQSAPPEPAWQGPSTLRLRVMPRWSPDVAATVAHRPVPFEFDAIVIGLDAAGQPAYITREQAFAMGGAEAVIETALNETLVQELTGLDVRDVEIAGERVRVIVKEGSPYVTTALLSIPRFLDDNAPHGVLVIAPSYDHVAIHDVRGHAAIELIPDLAATAADLSRRSAMPCSDGVFWWYGQQFHRIGVAEEGGEPVIDVPNDLRDVAWSL